MPTIRMIYVPILDCCLTIYSKKKAGRGERGPPWACRTVSKDFSRGFDSVLPQAQSHMRGKIAHRLMSDKYRYDWGSVFKPFWLFSPNSDFYIGTLREKLTLIHSSPEILFINNYCRALICLDWEQWPSLRHRSWSEFDMAAWSRSLLNRISWKRSLKTSWGRSQETVVQLLLVLPRTRPGSDT